MEKITAVDRVEYDEYLSGRAEANFLQSWQWGELHENLGHVVCRMGLGRNGKLVGAWTGIVKDARRGRYLEIPGGPLINWSEQQISQAAMELIRNMAIKHNCVFIRLRPQEIESKKMLSTLSSIGAIKAPMHLHAEHTNILNIQPSEEDLLSKMRRQTRYEVRRVQKRQILVESRPPSQRDIDEFYDLQSQTASRHGFVQSSRAFFQALREAMGDDLLLYQATKDGQLLNQALVVRFSDEADYFEAASTVEARKEPGAYGVVWQAICDAKAASCKRFNFWGIAYTDDPNHRYAGVTTFKKGFGGEDVTYVPAHDIVLRPGRYAVSWLIETIRRKRRGL